MSLEKEIASLTAAVKELTAASLAQAAQKPVEPAEPITPPQSAQPAPVAEPKPAPIAEPTPAPEPEPEPTPEPEPVAETKKLVLADLQALSAKIIAAKKLSEGKAVVSSFGVAKLADLTEDKFDAVYAALRKLL